MEKLRLFLALSVFALLVAACGGGETSSSSNQTTTQPVSVSLSDPSATAARMFVADSRVRFMPAMASMFAPSSRQQIPVGIFLTGKTGVRPLSKQEAESRFRELVLMVEQRQVALTSVTSDLRQRYGNRLRKWPKEAKGRYEEALLAFNVANVAAWEVKWFGNNTQKDIDDSVVDLEKILRKIKVVRLVESRNEAELVVEVRGRGWQPVANVFGGGDKRESCNFLGLTVSIGPSLHISAELADTLKWFQDSVSAVSVRRRGTNPPRWDLEATWMTTTFVNGPVTWWAMAYRAAAAGTASVIEEFVKKNYNTLDAGRGTAASAS